MTPLVDAPEESPRVVSQFLWRIPSGGLLPFRLQFETLPDSKAQEILDENGDQTFYHPLVGQPFTLHNFFAAANVDPNERFENHEAVLQRLEREPVDLPTTSIPEQS